MTILVSRARPVLLSSVRCQTSPLDIALRVIATADYMIQLIGARYGVASVAGSPGDPAVSVTHAEYREAYRRRIPLLWAPGEY